MDRSLYYVLENIFIIINLKDYFYKLSKLFLLHKSNWLISIMVSLKVDLYYNKVVIDDSIKIKNFIGFKVADDFGIRNN